MPSDRPRIIDAHVHLYPAEVAADSQVWARRMGEPLWAELVADVPERRIKQGWADCDRLLRDMDAAGVERAILLGWYWERQETCDWHNRFYADCVRVHPDRLSAFAAAYAPAGATAIDGLSRALDDGLCGIGELCPWSTGGKATDAKWMEVFAFAVARGVPVNLHVTDPASRPFPGRVLTPLEDVVALATALPELRLVLAHLGGGLVFHEANPHARRVLANVVYDTAAVPVLYRAGIYQQAVAMAGADRVLFGTDYPLLVHPVTEGEPGFAASIAQVMASGLGKREREQVLGFNAARLLAGNGRAGAQPSR